MIHCVVPKALKEDLYDRLADYYRDEPNVAVIVDRRAQAGRPDDPDAFEDRRRRRPGGSFPKIDAPASAS